MGQTKDVSYRKAYKSDHLGVVDLEEMIENKTSLIVEIRDVFYEEGAIVAGNRGNHNIAYFTESIKPLVLNATNANTVRKLCNGGANLSTWKMPVKVELFIDSTVKMKGQIVGGVRLKAPTIQQPTYNMTDYETKIRDCKTVDELATLWKTLPSAVSINFTNLKNQLKDELPKN